MASLSEAFEGGEAKVLVEQLAHGTEDGEIAASEFVCQICQLHVVSCQPKLTTCSHLFCGDCISRWMEVHHSGQSWATRMKSKGAVPCPVCKEPLHADKDLHLVCAGGPGGSGMLWEYLASIKIVCANHAKCTPGGTCTWEGDYGSYQEHVRSGCTSHHCDHHVDGAVQHEPASLEAAAVEVQCCPAVAPLPEEELAESQEEALHQDHRHPVPIEAQQLPAVPDKDTEQSVLPSPELEVQEEVVEEVLEENVEDDDESEEQDEEGSDDEDEDPMTNDAAMGQWTPEEMAQWKAAMMKQWQAYQVAQWQQHQQAQMAYAQLAQQWRWAQQAQLGQEQSRGKQRASKPQAAKAKALAKQQQLQLLMQLQQQQQQEQAAAAAHPSLLTSSHFQMPVSPQKAAGHGVPPSQKAQQRHHMQGGAAMDAWLRSQWQADAQCVAQWQQQQQLQQRRLAGAAQWQQ